MERTDARKEVIRLILVVDCTLLTTLFTVLSRKRIFRLTKMTYTYIYI